MKIFSFIMVFVFWYVQDLALMIGINWRYWPDLVGFRICWEFYTVYYLVLINAVAQGDGRFNKRNHDYKQYKEN